MLSKLIQKQKDLIKRVKGYCKAKRIENVTDVLTLKYSYRIKEVYDGPFNVIGYFVTEVEDKQSGFFYINDDGFRCSFFLKNGNYYEDGKGVQLCKYLPY